MDFNSLYERQEDFKADLGIYRNLVASSQVRKRSKLSLSNPISSNGGIPIKKFRYSEPVVYSLTDSGSEEKYHYSQEDVYSLEVADVYALDTSSSTEEKAEVYSLESSSSNNDTIYGEPEVFSLVANSVSSSAESSSFVYGKPEVYDLGVVKGGSNDRKPNAKETHFSEVKSGSSTPAYRLSEAEVYVLDNLHNNQGTDAHEGSVGARNQGTDAHEGSVDSGEIYSLESGVSNANNTFVADDSDFWGTETLKNGSTVGVYDGLGVGFKHDDTITRPKDKLESNQGVISCKNGSTKPFTEGSSEKNSFQRNTLRGQNSGKVGDEILEVDSFMNGLTEPFEVNSFEEGDFFGVAQHTQQNSGNSQVIIGEDSVESNIKSIVKSQDIQVHSNIDSNQDLTSQANDESPVVEKEPTDIVAFLKKHPKSDISFVLKYFSRKDIDKAMRLGRVFKRKNKLFV